MDMAFLQFTLQICLYQMGKGEGQVNAADSSVDSQWDEQY